MSNKINQAWVDCIRIFATILVVFLHTAGPLLHKYNELPKIHWWIGNIYDSFVRISVPLFFMISGYLLLEKSENLKMFFQKRLNKVLVPLFAWSLIYVFWKAYYDKSSPVSINSFYNILVSPVYYHLWFLYAIIGLYLFMPVLRVVVSNSDRKMLIYYVSLWFLAVSLIPLIEKATGLNSSIDLRSISGFSGYLVLGLLLGKHSVSAKVAAGSAFVYIACVGLTVIGTYILTTNNEGIFSGYFYGYLSPNVIIMSATAFIFLKYLLGKYSLFLNSRTLTIVQSLSSASLGIYLVHIMFLRILNHGEIGITLSCFVGHPIYSIPATAISVFLLSYIAVFVIKKIPYANRITP